MALVSPANIAEVSNTSSSFRFTFRSTLSTAGNLYLLLTPKIYTDFDIELEANSISAGNNQHRDFTFQWSNSLFTDVMRGISYNLSIALKTASDSSAYVATGMTVKRPYFATAINTADTPGFSITDAFLPANRVSDQVFSTDELEYVGTWHSYPRITLTGKFNYCKLVNTGTGAQIGIDSVVESNHIRVVETDPLSKQYGLWGGADEDNLVNKSGELGSESNIRDFFIPASNVLPRPMAIEAYFYNRNSDTNVEISYPIKYFALGDNPL